MAKAQAPQTPISATPELPEMPEEFKGMSLGEIQRAIAAADLQARLLDLDRIKDENAQRIAKKKAIDTFNKQIQEEITSQQRILEFAQSVCRHRQGGRYQNVYAGDGKPCIVRSQMLDGVTWLLQCTRCRLKIFTPHPGMLKSNPEQYAKDKAVYDRLWEMSSDSGLDEIRGPTFTFMRDGVPIVPERR
jgi:hypothetical protein